MNDLEMRNEKRWGQLWLKLNFILLSADCMSHDDESKPHLRDSFDESHLRLPLATWLKRFMNHS